eukprot:3589274-Prymnesium_polylepis.1
MVTRTHRHTTLHSREGSPASSFLCYFHSAEGGDASCCPALCLGPRSWWRTRTIPDARAPRGSFSQPAPHARPVSPEVSPIEPRHSGALTSRLELRSTSAQR